MIRVDHELTIGRTPADVFAHVTRVESFPDWQSAAGIRRVVRTDEGPMAAGSQFTMDRMTRGLPGRITCTVTAFEPDRRFAFHATDSDGFTADVETLLAPDGPATSLSWRLTMTAPGFYRFLEPVLDREVRNAADADFAALKRMLEAVAG